jgi:hypothetical protein
MKQTAEPPNLVPLLTATDLTGLSPSSLLDLIADQKARGERIGGSWYVALDDLDAYRLRWGNHTQALETR